MQTNHEEELCQLSRGPQFLYVLRSASLAGSVFPEPGKIKGCHVKRDF